MISGELRRWLAAGTGAGIEVRGEDLLVTVARVRPGKVRVLAGTVIQRFRQRPAAEWGAEYAAFLRSAGGEHLAATVLLPRDEVIVRTLSLPGVSARDTEAAISYQVDSLHPYAETEARYGWARLPDSQVVIIGIAHSAAIERYALLFAEAGVRVASFTFSAAAVYSAARIVQAPPAQEFLAVEQRDGALEVYGESSSRPIFSASFDLAPDNAVALALAELRLDPATQPVSLLDVLPAPKSAPEAWNQREAALSYAAALAGACPWLALPVNLLPAEQRATSSRAAYVPTAMLAALLAVALAALAAYGRIQDRRYQDLLQQEITRYTPEAAKVRAIEDGMAALRRRREALREFRLRTKADLDTLQELTRTLAPPAWLSTLQLTRTTLLITGEAPQAAPLLEALDKSPYFRNSEFATGITRAGEAERFNIRSIREGGAQ